LRPTFTGTAALSTGLEAAIKNRRNQMADETRQTRTVSLRVTRNEYEALMWEAERLELTISSLIRRELLFTLDNILEEMATEND
jgi:hypothetical protein